MKHVLFFFMLVLLFSSCIEEWDKELSTKDLKTKLIYKHPSISKSKVKCYASVFDNKLQIKFKLKPFDHLQLPERVLYYNWYLRFFYDGQVVRFPELLKQSTMYQKTILGRGNSLQYIVSTLNTLGNAYEFEMELPLMMLSQIKKGNSSFVIELFAGISDTKNSLANYTEVLEIPNFKFRWLVEIQMPPIYHTQITTHEIVLQDDEEFSPRGMDISLREGLPDIYWTINYPIDNKKHTGPLYWRSREAKYAVAYTYPDTIDFLHYSKKDRLFIGVYDRDDFSKDDFIGDWYGHFLTLYSDTFKSLSFDHITSFKIKATLKRCVNCK